MVIKFTRLYPDTVKRLMRAAMLASVVCISLQASAQTADPYGFEDNTVNGFQGTGSTETTITNNVAANVRTGLYSAKFTTTSASSNKQWYTNTPYAASANNIYNHYIYWAKAQDAGTSVDASLRYTSSAPPSGTGSSSNASSTAALSTTAWTRVTNDVSSSSTRYYFSAPRKTSSTATSFYMDDAVIYSDGLPNSDINKPNTPSALAGTVSGGNIVTLTWTSNTDAETGVQATIILRSSNTSATAPVFNDQAVYSVAGGNAGPNTIGSWTIVNTAVGATATTYDDVPPPAPGNYIYAVVLRDLAYNYSIATISSSVTVGVGTPLVNISPVGFTANFGTVVKLTTSAEQSYQVSGLNLTNDIVVTAPAGFEVSKTTGAGFASSISFTPTSSAVLNAPVFVRFAPQVAIGATGTLNITNASTGATTKNVPVSGTSIDTEPTTTGTISFGTITDTKIVVNLPTIGNGTNRIIVVKKDDPVVYVPMDGVAPTGVNADFGLATDQGLGQKIVYDGAGSGNSVVSVTGLTLNTLYYFAVYEYNNGTGASQNYLPVSPFTALAKTALVNDVRTTNISSADIKIFPNPNEGVLFIDAPVRVNLVIRDLTGRVVLTQQDAKRIDLASVSQGVYLVTLFDDKAVVLKNEKLFKTK